ncbi:MAG: neutral/alkaline non-lysosomal ceramidase N-terminal domain-containing protein, partial [Planctomycetaceae bacterium]
MHFFLRSIPLLAALLTSTPLISPLQAGDLQVGTALIDVTPAKLPVLVNGGMTSRSLDRIRTRVSARAIVFADSRDRAALVVVDSCMIGRVLLDEVKTLAAAKTGIPTSHILISATHAHSAPASMGCLGTDADPDYVPFLRNCLVEVIERALSKLQPAKIGFARTSAPEYT